MLDTTYNIRGLIQKFHIGDITDAELDELNAWRNERAENEADFQLLTDPLFVQKELRAVHALSHESEETLARIVQSRGTPVRRLTWLPSQGTTYSRETPKVHPHLWTSFLAQRMRD
jgi:hypothetical protein